MKPVYVALAIAAAALPATGQAPGAGEDHTVEVAPGIYNVTWGNRWGNMGLNVGVSVGDDGLLLIDAQEEAGVPRLRARIAEITDKPVRYVVNTHWHFDHVGGNAVFAELGAAIIAQENTRTRLAAEQPNPLGRPAQKAFAAAFWPRITFADRLTLHVNGDDVELLHFRGGHTDADTIALFHKADVLFAADLFNNSDYTRIDPRGGIACPGQTRGDGVGQRVVDGEGPPRIVAPRLPANPARHRERQGLDPLPRRQPRDDGGQ